MNVVSGWTTPNPPKKKKKKKKEKKKKRTEINSFVRI
jgi:hypothetical protein